MFRLNNARKITRRVEQHGDSVDVSEFEGVRSLHLGSSTIQSSMRVAAPYDLELRYSRGMMSYLLFHSAVREVMILGLGGGSIPKFLHHYLPMVRTSVVEIDPRVIEVARTHFMLPENDERLRVVLGDGAQYLPQHPASADLLILDAFDGSGVPSGLYSQDFFDTCAATLKPNGILATNLWGSDRNFDLYLQRIEQSFSHRVLVLPTGRPGNIVVFAFDRPPTDLRWSSLRERAKALEAELKIEFLEFVERLRDNNRATSNRLLMQ